MTYQRVIPRDLFNEGNLLKCLGQLYLNLERLGVEDWLEHDGGAFEIVQNEDGQITVDNVTLVGRGADAIRHRLWRPLNSRRSFPLYLSDDIEVFTESGEFTPDMLTFIQNGKTESDTHGNHHR